VVGEDSRFEARLVVGEMDEGGDCALLVLPILAFAAIELFDKAMGSLCTLKAPRVGSQI